MARHQYKTAAFLLCFSYWLLESVVHVTVFKEDFILIPHDSNELWMRFEFIALIMAIGIYLDRRNHRELQEKKGIFHSTIAATNHIVNNLLQQMLILKMPMDHSREQIKLLDEISQEASDNVAILNSLARECPRQLNAHTIYNSVVPKSRAN